MSHQDTKTRRHQGAMVTFRGGLLFFICLVFSCLCVFVASGSEGSRVGEKVADFRLPDATGGDHSLEGYRSSGKILMLVFWSFKCPVTLSHDKRLTDLQRKFEGSGVVVLAVDSNVNESAEEIRRNASMRGFPFPILLDREELLAERLGATHTPSVFILDSEAVLRYRGALDDNKGAGDSKRVAYAEDALEAILARRSVSQAETKVFGCSIKRKTF